MKLILSLFFAGLSFQLIWAAGGPPPEPLNSLVEAERAFARLSKSGGMRDAFLANLAEGSVVFQPGPTDGRKTHENSPNVPGMLQWEPIFADISSSGDLGYTTGPWVFRNEEKDTTVHGHYVTVWKKQADGAWKVVVDGGVSHPAPSGPAPELTYPDQEQGWKGPAGSSREDLLKAESEFSETAAEQGFGAALLARSESGTRVYRAGNAPVIGPQAIEEAFAGDPETWVWKPEAVDAASSGDLGYAYGTAVAPEGSRNPKPGAANSYFRIWKKNAAGHWMVVLDLANPLPVSK